MISRSLLLLFMTTCVGFAQAQDDASSAPVAADNVSQPSQAPVAPGVVVKLEERAKDEVKKIAGKLDQDQRAKTATAGILEPIYQVAEKMAFPEFHWLAFALMAAGVVSYTLQLVLGKLVVLMRMGFSLKEILSDAVGLAISVVGLVLTTQAATENSNFTQSPAAVLSATAVGLIAGIILYVWGQTQELQAVAGRTRTAEPAKKAGPNR